MALLLDSAGPNARYGKSNRSYPGKVARAFSSYLAFPLVLGHGLLALTTLVLLLIAYFNPG